MLSSDPEPRDPHRLVMSDSRLVDGGVVVMRYRPFCRCGFVGRPVEHEQRAVAEYEAHLEGAQR